MSLDLEAERSVNYELGFRTEPTRWLFLEATGFVMDFSNQIIPVAQNQQEELGFGVSMQVLR
jgi:Fe(3+) dicitrate transport protein